MAVMPEQVIAVPLFFVTLMLLCESVSQATPINYRPIGNFSPVCSGSHQENCVSHSPPVNEHQRPCNPSDHCRGGKSLTGTEKSTSKVEVSEATKQSGMQDHTFLPSAFCHGCWLVALSFWCLVCFWYEIHV